MQLTAICKNVLLYYYNRLVYVVNYRKNRLNNSIRLPAYADDNAKKTGTFFLELFNSSLTKRFILRMWIIAVLLFTVIAQVNATGYAQNVTFNQHHVSLKKLFSKINEQTGYLFLYNQEWIKLANKVDIVANNAPLEEVLNACFKNQPLTYTIVNKTIVLQLKPQYANNSTPTVSTSTPISIPITGQIKDDKGQPIPGVNVTVKGTKTSTQTNANGNYSINVPDENSTLVFTSIGFSKKEVKVDGKRTINLTLTETLSELSEVVVSGYTVQNRAEFTGSSSHIGGKELAERPAPSFDQALAGQAAGVKLTSSSGSLNSPPVFRIRGTNSITSSAYPLIIIDGVQAFTGNVGNSAENNPLSTINPDDIQSIEILKDASATAIYGSRGTDGVVVITTKKGKQGKAKVTYDGYVGMTKKPKLPKVLSAADYVMIKNESLVNNGSAPAYFLQQNPDGSTVQTNWYDYVYQTGKSQNHNLSVSGGSENTHYFFSGSYTDQIGFLVKNTFERGGTRFNIDTKLTKNITVGANVSYTDALNNNLTSGFNNTFGLNNLVRESMVLPPNLSPLNPDGSYNISGSGIGYGANTILTGYYNPLPQLQYDKYTSESKALLGNIFLEWELVKGLTGKINYSVNDLNTVNMGFSNPYQAGGFSTNGSATNTSGDNRRTDILGQLTYTTTFAGKHHLSVLAAYEAIPTTSSSWGVTKTNLTDRFYESFYGSFSTISGSTSTYAQTGLKSYFSNLFYDYDKKYLLSASFRRDGYSSLAYKYGNFPGGSIGWNIAEEGFFKSSTLAKTLSLLKLRASYGKTGNISGVSTYASSSLYSSGVYGGLPTLTTFQNGNPNLTWETSKKTDFGLNVGLFNNRIVIDADYFNNSDDGLILNVPQAASKGLPNNTLTENIGSMYNRGFEFNIEARIIDHAKFKWTANLNISTLKNKVTSLAPGVNDIWTSSLETTNITRVGYPVGAIYVAKTTGVNPANGLRTYLNKAGQTVQYSPVNGKWTYLDGTTAPALDAYGDGVVMGTTLPTYYGGFNNTFNYGNIDLTLNFTFSGGNQIYNGTKATMLDNRFYNNQTDILRRWTTPGQITDIPALHYNDQQASGSVLPNSYNVENDSYIKLGYASIGYRIPVKYYSRLGVSSVRIYGTAGNFILYTKYTGSDPEISANGDSNTAAGHDKNAVPAGKTFTLGLSVGF
ncbi:MAG: SusC/RagA family TonB-linked outer membrane protein [Mucilaginibacter sp.]|nr:SusC/RagA family TonB-linked outer membrane protein [Mucilaginibacter sp.]